MAGFVSPSRWLAALWAVMLLGGPVVVAATHTQTVALKVQGMVWPFCALTVESVLEKTEGVLAADASFVKGQAVITYDPQQTSPQALVEALNTQTLFRASLLAGNHFKTGTRQIALQFETPLDPERTWRIGADLKQAPGVTDVNALDKGRVGITFDPQSTDAAQIISQVEGLGYPVLGAEPLSQPEALPSDGGGIFLYWTLSGMVLLGIGFFVYRRQRLARRDLAPPDASSLGKESSS